MAICDFGKTVKKKLVDIDRTQEWLIGRVSEETGLYFDSSYLHKILSGKSRSPKIVDAICKILEISLQEVP